MNSSLKLNVANLLRQNDFSRLDSTNESLNSDQENNFKLQQQDITNIIIFFILMTALFTLNWIQISNLSNEHAVKLTLLAGFSIFIKIFYLIYSFFELKNVKRSFYCHEISFYNITMLIILIVDIISGSFYFTYHKVQ
ncbi:hypothetical protein CWI39_0208p0010 [Hamiltosporidium magnivora]|uniref:Transmembrane protein n=1 Tax=Hamiltosporidium magnivora TaxID=148818 RepID=A0A4V2JWK3_9MICR|nr:hypothetical protein CWI39_0208p0010 [Hamiltosporidium magnivora]TBU08551.1 hypothetical protein CWI36_0124p0020 [Hamiltosporidium magnivora]